MGLARSSGTSETLPDVKWLPSPYDPMENVQ